MSGAAAPDSGLPPSRENTASISAAVIGPGRRISPFLTIVDSGRVGIEKPDPRIFAHALELVGGRASEAVHIGDSWSAGIVGATGAGWRAIYYPSRAATPPAFADPRIRIARDAAEARAVLSDFGV